MFLDLDRHIIHQFSNAEYCIIRICVVHLGKAIPVGWRVIKHKSSSVKIATYQDLLKRISKLLPVNAKVILLADRGFANAELVRYVRQLGWLYARLCLVLAMTTLFLTAQGVQVVLSGQRRCVDPHWFRGSSYLKIGWSWVKQALNKGWALISVVSFCTNIDPDPVIASHLQHHKRTYRIEFKATTHVWTN
jgi:hypothetical protein